LGETVLITAAECATFDPWVRRNSARRNRGLPPEGRHRRGSRARWRPVHSGAQV